ERDHQIARARGLRREREALLDAFDSILNALERRAARDGERSESLARRTCGHVVGEQRRAAADVARRDDQRLRSRAVRGRASLSERLDAQRAVEARAVRRVLAEPGALLLSKSKVRLTHRATDVERRLRVHRRARLRRALVNLCRRLLIAFGSGSPA